MYQKLLEIDKKMTNNPTENKRAKNKPKQKVQTDNSETKSPADD